MIVTWGKKKNTKPTDHKILKGLFKGEFNRADFFKAYKVLQHTTVCIYLRMQHKGYWSSLDFKVTWLGNQSQCLFFSFFVFKVWFWYFIPGCPEDFVCILAPFTPFCQKHVCCDALVKQLMSYPLNAHF